MLSLNCLVLTFISSSEALSTRPYFECGVFLKNCQQLILLQEHEFFHCLFQGDFSSINILTPSDLWTPASPISESNMRLAESGNRKRSFASLGYWQQIMEHWASGLSTSYGKHFLAFAPPFLLKLCFKADLLCVPMALGSLCMGRIYSCT